VVIALEVESLSSQYATVFAEVLTNGEEVSPRGMLVKEVRPLVLTLRDPRYSIPGRAGVNRGLMWMEIAQLLAGQFRHNLYERQSKQAAALLTPFGAYGPRVADQYFFVLEELERDPDSRRAVIYIGDQGDLESTLHFGETDQPCTLTWQFFLRNGALEMLVNMRSWDIVWGLTYDIPSFTSVQRSLAWALGVEVGQYTHVAGSAHVYERHFKLRTDSGAGPLSPVTPTKRSERAADSWQDLMNRAAQALDSYESDSAMLCPTEWGEALGAWLQNE